MAGILLALPRHACVETFYSLLADLIVAVHVGYVSFILLGQVLILIGAALGWGWVRNRWFRVLHITAIVIVALEALANIACPLTVWEYQLRRSAGQTVAEGTFIGRCLHDLIFFDNLPPWVFTVAYVSFAGLVLATLIFIPPRWRTSTLTRRASEGESQVA